jgi:thiamine biosynthesis protein ThiI
MVVRDVEPATAERVASVHRTRVLVRLAGEMGTKSARTRRGFLAILVANAARALRAAGVKGSVRHEWSRLWVDTADPTGARQALAQVFGVHSVAEAIEVRFSALEDLVAALEPLYRERVRGRTFGIRARRAGAASINPQELAVALGAALLPVSAGVDLDSPQAPVQVLVGQGRAHALQAESPGPSGLPLGSGGRILALHSGGFDSPVATWRVMRRGAEAALVHFDLGGCGQVEEALGVARELMRRWAPGSPVQVHVVDLAPLVEALQERCDRRLRQVLLKRAMYRAAGILASELEAEALVTGEALAQVSTQTLRSLAVCEAAAGLPVLRPLIGLDKTEIIARARQIGTHEASEHVREHCSIAGGKVITWPRREAVEDAERLVAEEATDAWAAAQVANRRVIDLSRWEPPAPAAQAAPEVAEIPVGAVVVDVREPYEGPPAGDLQLPYSIALERLDLLQPERDYVLVCPGGLRSASLAVELTRRGYRAWSLRGGMARLPAGGD